MINKNYIKIYRDIFREILKQAPKGYYDECSLSSYAHPNKLISWLFWKRIDVVLSMPSDLENKEVLDFGCGGGVIFKYLAEHKCNIIGCENQFYQLSKDIAKRLNVEVDIYKDLFEIRNKKFDFIFALDILEHIYKLDLVIDKLLELSHHKTKIIISGPTENLFYKIGRILIGYVEQGRFHERNIYGVEGQLKKKGLKRIITKNIYSPFPIFRLSLWSL